MKIGDLVKFCLEVLGTPMEDRALGIVVNISNETSMITVLFPTDDIPYSSDIEDFEVVSENR